MTFQVVYVREIGLESGRNQVPSDYHLYILRNIMIHFRDNFHDVDCRILSYLSAEMLTIESIVRVPHMDSKTSKTRARLIIPPVYVLRGCQCAF